MSDESLNASVCWRQDLNPTLCILRVRPDHGAVPAFEPGQFATIGLPRLDGTRLIRRAYSIASSPSQRDYLEFFLALVDNGKLTPRLWQLAVGGRLWLDEQIKGRFTLEPAPPDRTLVMVATGTGLAPFMSMLRFYRGKSRWRRFILVHGVRYQQDLAYRQELEQTARQDDTVLYIPTLSREPADAPWSGSRGRVQSVLQPHTFQHLTGQALDPARCSVFLCGNPQMIEDVEAQLAVHGFATASGQTPGNLHFERYW